MNGLHGIIFSYEKEPGLRELVEHRVPGSIPFGGRYRVVDFMLSNMQNAGITDVGVVLDGNYQSLLDHLGNGKTWDMSRKYGGLRLLPHCRRLCDRLRVCRDGHFPFHISARSRIEYLEDDR